MVSNLFGNASAATKRCLITTALCVYTAVHLNVAGYNERKILWIDTQTWRKLGWLVLGLLAPEMVAMTAWYQRREARYFVAAVNHYLGTPEPSSWYSRIWRKCRFRRKKNIEDAVDDEAIQPLWTMRHGFFAVMGGFVFDTTGAPHQFMPIGYERLTLDLDAICYLLKHEPDLLPYITADGIDRKSQAGGLGKLLVCLQALWFCVQCVTRLASSLPISLLELNTFGHSLCTILIYLMWWEKPMDVMEPTIIFGPKAWFCCASFYMSNTSSGCYDTSEADLVYNLYNDNFPPKSGKPKDRREGIASIAVSEGRLPLAEVLKELVAKGATDLAFTATRRQILRIQSSEIVYEITPIHRRRWQIVSEGLMEAAGTDREQNRELEEKIATTVVTPRIKNLPPITKLKQNISRADSDFNLEGYRRGWVLVQLGFVSAGVIYGGLHALAWNAPFSSTAQKFLWRLSSALIMSVGVGAVVLVMSRNCLIGVTTWFTSFITGKFSSSGLPYLMRGIAAIFPIIVYFLSLALMALCSLVYVLARIYLVVECFINVAHLPIGVYTVAKGANYIFHFS